MFQMKNAWLRLLLSALLGLVTIGAISAVVQFSPFSAFILLTDLLSLPGYIISRTIYPAGVHTGRGEPDWAWAFLVTNLLFYVAFWFLILQIIATRRKRLDRQS